MKATELILNPDGSIFHLHLKPGDIGDQIILVGDPARVGMVAQFFDTIEVVKQNREFETRTGTYDGKRLTVISTGIGTDNIDIVLQELDAITNINLETGEVNKEIKQLEFVRIGTSGSIQKSVDVSSIVLSQFAIGFGGLMNYYTWEQNGLEAEMQEKIKLSDIVASTNVQPYVAQASEQLFHRFFDDDVRSGITATCNGFYGPQGRTLRIQPQVDDFTNKLASLNLFEQKVMNLEMETAAIYGLAKALGHEALSINLIIANRMTGNMKEFYQEEMTEAIQWMLQKF